MTEWYVIDRSSGEIVDRCSSYAAAMARMRTYVASTHAAAYVLSSTEHWGLNR